MTGLAILENSLPSKCVCCLSVVTSLLLYCPSSIATFLKISLSTRSLDGCQMAVIRHRYSVALLPFPLAYTL